MTSKDPTPVLIAPTDAFGHKSDEHAEMMERLQWIVDGEEDSDQEFLARVLIAVINELNREEIP